MMRSLHSRLAVGMAAGASVLLLVAGMILVQLTRAELYREFDLSLANEARALAALVEYENGRLQTEIAEHDLTAFRSPDHAVQYSIWEADGRLHEQSKGLHDSEIVPFGGTLDQPKFQPLRLPGDVPGRMVGVRFYPHQADGGGVDARSREDQLTGPITLVVAHDTEALLATLGRIRVLLVSVFGGTTFAFFLIGWLIVRLGLRPLWNVSAQIQSLGVDGLEGTLAVEGAPPEVEAVVACLNGLLARLHEAFERERAFSANVAHELRTPLAGLHTTIEVALAKPTGAANDRRALERCLSICRQAEALTENLLVLARLDAKQYRLETGRVSLSSLLHEVETALIGRAKERDLKVTLSIEEPAEVSTDRALLTLIVRNLFDNAVSYADEGTPLEVRAWTEDEVTNLSFYNTARGLTSDAERHVFDRFWRGDGARARTGQHAGVGLSLCQQAALVLGGQLLVSVRDGCLTATLSLNAAAADGRAKADSVRSPAGGGQGR